jgi:branched-chain amino acid aminotransferase
VRDFGHRWVEEPPAIARICADADAGRLKEVFACGTAAVVTPVGAIHFGRQDHRIGDGQEGPLTKRLRETLCEIHTGTSGLHPEWVFKVPVHSGV